MSARGESTRAPLPPWKLIPLLDGRDRVDFWVLKSDLRPERRLASSYLIWLARRYGYAFSSAVSARTTHLAVPRPAFKVTVVRDDSPAGRRRAAETRHHFPRAGRGGAIPGLVSRSEEGGPRLAAETLKEVLAWERILVHEGSGAAPRISASLCVLTSAAVLWLAYALWNTPDQVPQTVLAATVSALLALGNIGVTACRRCRSRRIRQAGYVKIHPPDGTPHYTSFTDLTVR